MTLHVISGYFTPILVHFASLLCGLLCNRLGFQSIAFTNLIQAFKDFESLLNSLVALDFLKVVL